MSYPSGMPAPPATHPASPQRQRGGYAGPSQAELDHSRAQALADSPLRSRAAAPSVLPVQRPTQAELDLSRAQALADSPPRVRGGPIPGSAPPMVPMPVPVSVPPGPSQAELDASRAQAAADVRKPPPVLKLHGMKGSPNVFPVLALLLENSIPFEFVPVDLMKGEHLAPEFKAKCPMHCVPMLEDGDLCLWESGAILRYICNKYRLESWYPSEAKRRALCDMMLDFRATSFASTMGPVFLYPRVGFGTPKTAEEEEAAVKQYEEDLWPTIKHVIAKNGGAFVGGHRPNIADLGVQSYLWTLSLKAPDHAAVTAAGVKEYLDAFKKAITPSKWAEAYGDAEVFFSQH